MRTKKPSRHFLVRWEIDLDATSEVEAARAALKIMRDPNSIATVFDVARRGRGFRQIDLNDTCDNG